MKRDWTVDFYPPYVAAKLALKGKDYYQTKNIFQEIQKFISRPPATRYLYPPLALTLYIPFTLLPAKAAQDVWIIVQSLFFLTGTLFLLYSITSLKKNIGMLLVGIALLSLNWWVFKSLELGQINGFLFWLLCVFIFGLVRKKSYVSGIALASAILLKIFPLIFLPYLLIKKQYKIFAISLSFLILLLASSLIFFGYERNKTYLFKTLPPIVQGLKYDTASRANQTMFGFLDRATPFKRKIIRPLHTILTAITFIALAWMMWKKPFYPHYSPYEVSMLLLFFLIFSRITHGHYLSLLIIPTMLFLFLMAHLRASFLNFIVFFLGIFFAFSPLQFLDRFSPLHMSREWTSLFPSTPLLGILILFILGIYLYMKYNASINKLKCVDD